MSLISVPSEVAQPVPPSELVLGCWIFLVVEYFYSESMVILGAIVIFASEAELYFFAKCEQSD